MKFLSILVLMVWVFTGYAQGTDCKASFTQINQPVIDVEDTYMDNMFYNYSFRDITGNRVQVYERVNPKLLNFDTILHTNYYFSQMGIKVVKLLDTIRYDTIVNIDLELNFDAHSELSDDIIYEQVKKYVDIGFLYRNNSKITISDNNILVNYSVQHGYYEIKFNGKKIPTTCSLKMGKCLAIAHFCKAVRGALNIPYQTKN